MVPNPSPPKSTTPSPPENEPPIADVRGPYVGFVGTPISFDGSGCYDPDGNVVEYKWNFGDGSDSYPQSPSHTYDTPGLYPVSLKVTDDDGATDTDTTTCNVQELNEPPIADAGGPYLGIVGVPLSLSSSGSHDPEGSSLEYRWKFGDGESSSAPHPSHIYDAEGTYTVSLTVTDDEGNMNFDTTTCLIKPQSVRAQHDLLLRSLSSAQIYYLRCVEPGEIRVRATWTGSQSSLTLTINGPGPTKYSYQAGTSPLEVSYNVGESDFEVGKPHTRAWLVTLANSGSGQARGTVEITYPSGSSVTPFKTDFSIVQDNVRNIDLIVLTKPGDIKAQATWTGTPSNLALTINGPGQTGNYARQDGSSPLSVSYSVTAHDLAYGDTWRVSTISLSEPNAEGEIYLSYP